MKVSSLPLHESSSPNPEDPGSSGEELRVYIPSFLLRSPRTATCAECAPSGCVAQALPVCVCKVSGLRLFGRLQGGLLRLGSARASDAQGFRKPAFFQNFFSRGQHEKKSEQHSHGKAA